MLSGRLISLCAQAIQHDFVGVSASRPCAGSGVPDAEVVKPFAVAWVRNAASGAGSLDGAQTDAGGIGDSCARDAGQYRDDVRPGVCRVCKDAVDMLKKATTA